jgi:hypothetical protein
LSVDMLLESIDLEIERLTQARGLLVRTTSKSNPRPTAEAQPVKRRKMSKEARDRIAAAQRKRWAKSKRAAK